MSQSKRIFEKDLYDIWIEQKFTETLHTIDGNDIAILDSGLQNTDTGGPDFQNARVRIGNLVFVGDIEIDGDYRDWKSHGHHINNKYNKVILHASLHNKFNQPYVYSKDGRKIPSINLSEFIAGRVVETLEKEAEKDNHKPASTLKCDEVSNDVEYKIREKFVSELGAERFKKKCQKFYARLKELKYISDRKLKEPVISYDLTEDFENKEYTHEDFKERELWLQLFYEHVFEALGYSKNKSIMLKLARAADVNFLSSLNGKNFKTSLESALFGISGLLPDAEKLPENQSSEYTKNIFNAWSTIKDSYDSETFSETDWNFFRLRPQNFPTVRIAGGAVFLNSLLKEDLIAVLIKKIKEIRKLNVLVNSLRSVFVIPSEGFWQDHYVFDSKSSTKIKYFVGAGRADEIVINVVLPFFAVYFEVFGNKEMAKKVFKLFSIYKQRSDNRIVRDVSEGIGLSNLSKRTIHAQGMIELFRNYCSKGKCLECEIGKIAFN